MLDLYVQNKNSIKALGSALKIAISNAITPTPGYKYTYTSFTTTYAEAISSGTENTNQSKQAAGCKLDQQVPLFTRKLRIRNRNGCSNSRRRIFLNFTICNRY